MGRVAQRDTHRIDFDTTSHSIGKGWDGRNTPWQLWP